MVIFFIVQAVAIFLLSQAHTGNALASNLVLGLLSAVIGAAYGSNLALFPSITKDYYGIRNFGVNNFFSLMSVDFKPGDTEKLIECVGERNYELFLQNKYGPLMSEQPPRQPGFGPNSLGLRTFIEARYESVRKQLDGELPRGTGSGDGNGGSMWMVDMFSFMGPPPIPENGR